MGRACVTKTFNPPPRWPEPPRPGWVPPEGWRPDRSWGEVPSGWRLWTRPPQPDDASAPLTESEDIPASGVGTLSAPAEYPVAVTHPGVITDMPAPADDHHGFGAAKVRTPRPRLRLALTIVVTVLGLAVAGATVLAFLWIIDFAHTDLESSATGALVTSATEAGALPPDVTAPLPVQPFPEIEASA